MISMSSRPTTGAVAPWLLAGLLLALPVLHAEYADAESRTLFDFEGPYLVDAGRTIKDHSMVHDGQRWHCFYIRGQLSVPGTTSETQLGHAVTEDLRHWTPLADVMPVVPGTWESRNVWAPHVIATPGGGGWTMLYTARGDQLMQRMGMATSSDLLNWTRHPSNPLLSPDPVTYWFDPAFNYLAAFRDPYVYEEGGQYHVLNTALLRDAGLPSGIRGAIHHAVSNDLVSWTSLAPLATNNATSGASREIESVQLVRNGTDWNLFFTLSFVEGVRWVRNDSMASNWNVAGAIEIDGGIAAEVTPIAPGSWLFTRHTADVHGAGHPDAGQIFYTLRADTLRFHPTTKMPIIVRTDALAGRWPTRTGNCFLSAPTFGDNQIERGETRAGLIGHGYLSSREFYSGPLSGFGAPGLEIGVSATGTLESAPFSVLASDSAMTFLLSGSDDPGCRLELIEKVVASGGGDSTVVHRTIGPDGSTTLGPRYWEIADLAGRSLRLRVVDESATGWIAIDHVQIVDDGSTPTAAPPRPAVLARWRPNVPNPFNPRTELRWTLDRAARVELAVVDLRGRRLRSVDLGTLAAGEGRWEFDGKDALGRPLASGVYFVELRVAGERADVRKIGLVR